MYTPTHTTCCVCYINDFFPDFSHLIAIKCAMRLQNYFINEIYTISDGNQNRKLDSDEQIFCFVKKLLLFE